MTFNRWTVSRRTLLGLGLGAWVILVILVTLRTQADGSVWGLRVGLSTDGGAVATEVNPFSNAWTVGIRPGDVLLTVDAVDARTRDGQLLLTGVAEIAYQNHAGELKTGRRADVTPAQFGVFTGGALLFAMLGMLVYRWSADVALGRMFLLFSGAFATALAAAPSSAMGIVWPGLVAGPAAVLAASGLLGVFLYFPRTWSWSGRAGGFVTAVAAVLGIAHVLKLVVPAEIVPIIDTVSWAWMGLMLTAAIFVLALRTNHRADRGRLVPLLVGTAMGVSPICLLTVLPRVVGLPVLATADFTGLAVGTIPISFAYAILRHQVFALDALLRRVVLRVSGALVGLSLFTLAWMLTRAFGVERMPSVVIAVVATGLIMPSITGWVAARLDALLYQPMFSIRSTSTLEAGDLPNLGAAVAQRMRQLLPVQWSAVVLHDDDAPVNAPVRRLLGADGALPSWLDRTSTLDQAAADATVTVIHRFEFGAVLLLAGPRLDGVRLDGIQSEAMGMLARGVAAHIEAALLRERAEDEARFRHGLTDLARDLAVAATVVEVERSLTAHALRLLEGASATLWRNGPNGWSGVLGGAIQSKRPPLVLRRVAESASHVGRERDWSMLAADGASVAFALDDGGDEPLVCLVQRDPSAPLFSAVHQQRAKELAEHTGGALRRAAERELLEEQLRHRAFYDSLTGLPNRALFLDRIAHATARADRLTEQLAVLFIDLDRFKVVNDSLGHGAGDDLLVEVATRLRKCLRESDTIARLGGDEFTVLLEGPSAMADAVQVADRILASLEAPFELDGQEMFAAASIGIAGGTAIRESGRDLLREADIALYRAKAAGRARYVLFEPRMNHLPAEHLQLESDLHRAIERNELRVHYQPIFSLADGRITGLEALVRWDHPEKGLIPPGQFIPLAEDTGLIVNIGRWVLAESCRQMREWQREVPAARDLTISVNLSARQLQDLHLIDEVQSAVRASGLDPACLQLEITESVVMQEPEATVFKLNALKTLGIKIAVDDFGTGYSSLAYLKRFPVDVLKIDRAFVGGLTNGAHDSAIVQTVVNLARALGLTTTAEGIEDMSQWRALEALGCDKGQGFIFSRPLRPELVQGMLLSGGPGRTALAA